MEFFYSNNIKDDLIILDNVESKHCIKVLRKSIGDKVNVVDGNGNLYIGIIHLDNSKECQIKIIDIINDYNNKNFYIHIAISPIKNHHRLEWFVEKAIEIGIDEISFIDCNRTLKKIIKMERIKKTAISAMKQTLKAKLPKINKICNYNDFIRNNKEKNKFICHLEKENKSNIFSFKVDIQKNKNVCILIGPEGDFTENEINNSKNYNFKALTLGESRLRTETAGIIACHLLNIININD